MRCSECGANAAVKVLNESETVILCESDAQEQIWDMVKSNTLTAFRCDRVEAGLIVVEVL